MHVHSLLCMCIFFVFIFACLVEASPVENFLRAERVSVNSYKSRRVMAASYYGRNVVQGYYRTQSHAGFPKGSYAIPNPTHFHVARQSVIAKMRPILITIPPSNVPTYTYNRRFNSQPTVTLNLGDAHSVSVNIPLEVITGFIYPIAAALNVRSVPVLNSQSSQTSYMKNFEYKRPDINQLNKVEYTPLYIDSYQTCHIHPERVNQTESFEGRVLRDMEQRLMADFSRSLSVSESDTDGAEKINEIDTASSQEIVNFNEGDELENNESLVDITPEVVAMFPPSDSSSSSGNGNMGLLQELPFYDEPYIEGNAYETIFKVAENFVDNLIKMSTEPLDYPLFEDVINTAKNYLRRASSEDSTLKNFSVDEGIEDCTVTNDSTVTPPKLDRSVNENIIRMSNLIFDYLVQQCFEVRELILFPEVLHDVNVNKLLSKLTQVYEECYGDSLKDEEKSNLRLSVASHVLKLLEIDERFREPLDDCNDSNVVNDKIFTISEFLSDILDHFFNNIKAENDRALFENFEKQVGDENENVFHSTPESKKGKDSEMLPESEVTSFKKHTKSGAETYWITLYHSPRRDIIEESPRNRSPFNVDDIPLKPPEDLIELNRSKKTLSPILEEPRANLFDSHYTVDDFKIFSDVDVNKKYEIVDDLDSSDDVDAIDKILSGECETINSYVAFDRPEVNVLVSNEVNFHRTKTINSNSYVQSKSAVFKPRVTFADDNKENVPPDDDDSGDWMGYEAAKF